MNEQALTDKELPVKKISHSWGARPCAPKNLQIILDNLFFGNP
jgi:hypothetical protein